MKGVIGNLDSGNIFKGIFTVNWMKKVVIVLLFFVLTFGLTSAAPLINEIVPNKINIDVDNWIEVRGTGFSTPAGIWVGGGLYPISFTQQIDSTLIKVFIPKASTSGLREGTYNIKVKNLDNVESNGVGVEAYKKDYPEINDDFLPPSGIHASVLTNVVEDSVSWTFSYSQSNGDSVKYRIDKSEIQVGLLSVHTIFTDGKTSKTHPEIIPINNGGTEYVDSSGSVLSPTSSRGYTPILKSSLLNNKVLTLLYDENDPKKNSKTYLIYLAGKTLVVEVSSSGSNKDYYGNYKGFVTGSAIVPSVKTIDVNYMMASPIHAVINSGDSSPSYFYTLYYDPTQTNGQEYRGDFCNKNSYIVPCVYPFGYNGFEKNTKLMPLKDKIYLTVSGNTDDLITKLENYKISEYKTLMNDKIYLESYAGDYVRNFNDDDAIVLEWKVQEDGDLGIHADFHREIFGSCWYEKSEGRIISEGSRFKVMHNDVEVYVENLAGTDYSQRRIIENLKVKKDDSIRFLFHAKNNKCDYLYTSIKLYLNGIVRSFPEDYSKVQGDKGWYYKSYFGNSFKELEYDNLLDRWQSDEYFGYINKGGMSPISNKAYYYYLSQIDDFYNFGIDRLIFFPSRIHYGQFTWPGALPASFVRGGPEVLKQLISKVTNTPNNNFILFYTIPTAIGLNFGPVKPNYLEIYKSIVPIGRDGSLRAVPGDGHPDVGLCLGSVDYCPLTSPPVIPFVCPTIDPFKGGACLSNLGGYRIDMDMIFKNVGENKPYDLIDVDEMKNEYKLNALYTDILGAFYPEFYINYGNVNYGTRTVAEVISGAKRIALNYKKVMQGPLFYESSAIGGESLRDNHQRIDIYYGGYADSSSYLVDLPHSKNLAFIPDFVHKSLNPILTGYGVGIFPRAYVGGGNSIDYKEYDIRRDWYRALEVGYGFGSYENPTENNVDVSFSPGIPRGYYPYTIKPIIREFYLITGIQKQYLSSSIKSVLYESNGI